MLGRAVRRALPVREHASVDEAGTGFTAGEFSETGARCDLALVRLDPVWFLCGFLHYALELLFRLLRLRLRIELPHGVECTLVRCDQALLRIPGMRHLAWHYTALYRKPEEPPP